MSAPADVIQNPYLVTLNLTTLEHLKLYNKAIIGLPGSYRYRLTRSKWAGFYQKLEDTISIFGFKTAVQIILARYVSHVTTKFKNFISSSSYITKTMINWHCETLWEEKSGAYLGRHPTADFGGAENNAEKQVLVVKQRLSSKMLHWYKTQIEGYNTSSAYNSQFYEATIFFVVSKMAFTRTHTGYSDTKTKLETIKLYQFNHSLPMGNSRL